MVAPQMTLSHYDEVVLVVVKAVDGAAGASWPGTGSNGGLCMGGNRR